ncbi:hypothetical protein VB005_09311 [Metarhizium brunneum]
MLLNTMVMISGGRNYLLATPGAREDQTQGCVKSAAYVPPTMIAIFLLVSTLSLLSLVAFLTMFLWFTILKRNLPQNDVREIETVPQDVLEWALLAARRHTLGPANHGENDLADANGANMNLPLIQEGTGAPEVDHAVDGAGATPIEAKELREFRIGFERENGEGRTVGIFRRASR